MENTEDVGAKMNIYLSLILLGIAFLVFQLGFRTWWKDRGIRTNFAFFCMSASTFIWAGSQAMLMICPEEHGSIFTAGSALGASLFGVFNFLFMLFSKIRQTYIGAEAES